MSLECVQLLNTFISREYTFIKLSEVNEQDRANILETLSKLNIPTKSAPTLGGLRSGSSSDSLGSMARSLSPPARSDAITRSSPPDEESEDQVKKNMMEMRNLVCAMEELICILKSR